MKYITLLFVLLSTNVFSSSSDFNYSTIASIPILSEGRVKPLETFARTTLLSFHNRTSLKDQSATEWLIELLFDQRSAYRRPIFKVVNDDVLNALNLKKNDTHDYNFIELYSAFQNIQDLINELQEVAPEDLEPSQEQLIKLYANILTYLDISRSLSLISPEIEIPEKSIRAQLNLPNTGNTTFLELTQKEEVLKDAALKAFKLNAPEAKRFAYIFRHLDLLKDDNFSSQLKIVPIMNDQNQVYDWMSFWQLDLKNQVPPIYANYLTLWNKLYHSYLKKSPTDFIETSLQIQTYSAQFLDHNTTTTHRLETETLMNRLDLLNKSIALYILSFLSLSLGFIFKRDLFKKISFGGLILGAVFHLTHIIFRCYILARPPVSNLYESTLFVGIVVVIFAAIVEYRRRDGLGTLIGTLLGTILLFIGFGYQKEGDTLGMLVAVLDTNFWLATHVVTISIGYGCCLVASILGHLYLILSVKSKDSTSIVSLEKNIRGSVHFSLFFTVLGTILGGIWADQSWGRFWGWDPKENGALLICLWLIWIIHGKLSGKFRSLTYAVAVSFTSVIVIIAWFGVNLLSVGLHSYGFTDNIAHNILYFSLFEVIFLIVILILNYFPRRGRLL